MPKRLAQYGRYEDSGLATSGEKTTLDFILAGFRTRRARPTTEDTRTSTGIRQTRPVLVQIGEPRLWSHVDYAPGLTEIPFGIGKAPVGLRQRGLLFGAMYRDRTGDTRNHNPMLYQLS